MWCMIFFEHESIDTALLNKIGIILRIDYFWQKEYKRGGV